MGFRKNRRHRGGGGGGGGGGHGGGQHAHDGRAWTGEPNGLQPGDDVGNRKSFKPVIVPPDDLGNRRDPDEEEHFPSDDVGNRVDASPTHEISGVLLDLDPKKRRRSGRPKGAAPIERVGRYLVGGVNPIIAGGNRPIPPPSQPPPEQDGTSEFDLDEGTQGFRVPGQPPPRDRDAREARPQAPQRKRFEQVDGVAAQEVNERRAQRFFDFDEDDRFEYTLKTPADTKRAEAERFVKDIVHEAGRDAAVAARIIEDGDKPKLLVTIDDKGPLASLSDERKAGNAAEPLFVMGNAALMSLNYIVNKVVNRYPDDRIRLAVLPLNDERLYLESLDEHRRRTPVGGAPQQQQQSASQASSSSESSSSSPASAPRRGPRPPDAAPASPSSPSSSLEPASATVAPLSAREVDAAAARAHDHAAAVDADTAEAIGAGADVPPSAAVAPARKKAAPNAAAVDDAPAETREERLERERAERRPSKKAASSRGGRKPKKSEEIIPAPSEMPPEPPPAPVLAAAPEAEAQKSGRRRAPVEEEAPRPKNAAALDDDKKTTRPRPRRTSTALVEVVRVPKKP